MIELNYHLLDVFTNIPFGGNQLAVFTDPPANLSQATMQKIGKEMNLAEITFVFPPEHRENDYRVRIFTPTIEMKMAGHPTVGTGYLLAREGFFGAIDKQKAVTFEELIGPIKVTVNVDDSGQPTIIQMRQPMPQFLDIHEDKQMIADLLSLSVNDLSPVYPVQVVSTGVPFLLIPVTTLEAIGRIKVRLDMWEQFRGSNAEQLFAFTSETQYEGSTVHSRMFAPAFGIPEDPATGAASGPLGAYLVKYGIVETGGMVSEQGIEMGRPSFININIGYDGTDFNEIVIGGECVYMGRGTLLINES